MIAAVKVVSGSLSVIGGEPTELINQAGLSVALGPPTWLAGVLTMPIKGPQPVTIVSCATDGGSGTLITCDGGITADLVGKTVTIAGAEAAGAETGTDDDHVVVTAPSDTTFTIASPAGVGGTGGTVTLTVALTFKWGVRGDPLVVTP